MQFLIRTVGPRIQLMRRVKTLANVVNCDGAVETTGQNIGMIFVKKKTSDGF